MEVFKIFGDDSELHLSRRDGSIAAMRRRGKELLLPARLAFSLRFVDAEGGYRPLDSGHFANFELQEQKTAAVCRWTGCAGAPGTTVKLDISFRDRAFRFRPEVTGVPEELRLELVDAPVIVVPESNELFWPRHDGCLVDQPEKGSRYFQRLSAPGMAVGGCYPGPCQMQYMASYSPDGGIWFGAEDFRHGTKTLEFGADDGDGTRIRLRIEQYCGQDGPPERYAPDYDIVLRPFEGDWTDAAAICRDQVKRDPSLKSIPPKPEWLDESPVAVILSIRGRGESFAGENAYSRCENAFPRLRELSEAFGSPVLALLMRWDRHGPWLPPWCWPPAGGTESLFRLRDLLHESGNRIGLYCSGTAFTVRSLMNGYTCRDEFERDGLNRRMACGPDGKTLWTMDGIREGTQLCITEEFGREIMLDQVRRIAEAGIDYLQFFDQNFGGICYPCYSKEHRHPPVPGRWQTEAMTRLIDDMNEQIRRTGSRMILGTESSASMPYLAGLPLNDSRRICQVVYGRPVPAYSFVYHRYAGSFLGNQCTVWQNVDCPACPDNLLYRLAEGFCAGELLAVTLRADGSIAWGAADDWSEPPPDSETAITLIRNLNRLRRKYRKFLLHGEMEKSPVQVAGLPAYRLPLRPRRQHAGGGKAFTELPPLPESCWSAPDGERIQFLVNFRPEPRQVELRSTEPCRIGGREFGPGGFRAELPPLDALTIHFRQRG